MKIEYNNLYTHFVFTTLHREPIIKEEHRIRIEKYITGIAERKECKLYAIYANPEHIHFLISRAPHIDEETLANIIADSSAKFINENKLCNTNFQWQQSCSAFSVSKGDIDKVCKYILNQPKHHKRTTFQQEYEQLIEFYQNTINPIKSKNPLP